MELGSERRKHQHAHKKNKPSVFTRRRVKKSDLRGSEYADKNGGRKSGAGEVTRDSGQAGRGKGGRFTRAEGCHAPRQLDAGGDAARLTRDWLTGRGGNFSHAQTLPQPEATPTSGLIPRHSLFSLALSFPAFLVQVSACQRLCLRFLAPPQKSTAPPSSSSLTPAPPCFACSILSLRSFLRCLSPPSPARS